MHITKNSIINTLFLGMLILGISACNGTKDGATSPEYIIGEGPIADAGEDQTVIRGNSIILDGGGSTDPDAPDEELSYSWDLGALGERIGEVVEGKIPSNIPAGTYEVTLRVTDAEGNVAVDTMTITVENPPPPPVPVAPVNDTLNSAPVAVSKHITIPCIDQQATIVLLASDVDGDTLTYSIVNQPNSGTSRVSISGNIATYSNDATDACYGDFPPTEDSFSFRVNDGTANSNEAVVNITLSLDSL